MSFDPEILRSEIAEEFQTAQERVKIAGKTRAFLEFGVVQTISSGKAREVLSVEERRRRRTDAHLRYMARLRSEIKEARKARGIEAIVPHRTLIAPCPFCGSDLEWREGWLRPQHHGNCAPPVQTASESGVRLVQDRGGSPK